MTLNHFNFYIFCHLLSRRSEWIRRLQIWYTRWSKLVPAYRWQTVPERSVVWLAWPSFACSTLLTEINNAIDDGCVFVAQNKLYQIYPTIPSYSTVPYFSHRKDQILYNRLCIGHTRLTHSYLIEHINPPKCIHCNQPLSVKHILTECTSYDQTRHQYYSFTDIKNIFNHTPNQNVLNYIKKINLYNQL